jgi:hypothetical protein
MLTEIVIIVTTVLIIGYDVYAYKKGGATLTVSLVMKRWAMKYPWIILLWGVLMGHFFWPINTCF